MPKNKLYKIAIVGRPNVGKSSLFNRIIGSRAAIVEPASGTTRDRLYSDINWRGKLFTIVDTGGFDDFSRGDISVLILKQLTMAIEEADIIFFVTDGAAGVLPQDIELSSILRKSSKKIYLVVNKIDDSSNTTRALEFFELGLGEPYSVSAVNGTGIDKLLDDAAGCMEKSDLPSEKIDAIKVAIVGRPNVGKSSYLNAILKEERSIVHSVAGTTRDSLDTDFNYKDKWYCLIDTAGMRHNPKLVSAADFYGGVRSKEAVKRSDVVVMLIDGLDGMREDDSRIVDLCATEGKALIIAVNKWDLVKGMEMTAYKDMLVKKMNSVKHFPVIFISAKTGRNVMPSLDLIRPLYEKSKKVFSEEEFKGALELLNNSAQVRNKKVKFTYLHQQHINPTTFILRAKDTRPLNENLRQYSENFLRAVYNLEGVPVKLGFEKKQDKAADAR